MELLRPARMEDYEALNRIAAQVGALHASWGNGMAVDYPYPMDYYQEFLKEEKLLVAELDGEVVGYLNFYFWTAGGPAAAIRKMISIDDIGVEESRKHQGIGTRMMQELADFARERGCAGLSLYVDAPNEKAIAFYKKCGLHIGNYGMNMKL